MLEYDRRERHKENTAKQDEDDGGDDTNLGLTDIPLLQRQRQAEREVTGREGFLTCAQDPSTQGYHGSTASRFSVSMVFTIIKPEWPMSINNAN